MSRQQLQAIVSPNDHSSWDVAWKQNITPWDNGNTQPPLKQILQELPLTGRRALVPGCGAGYDAIHIASVTNYQTLGLDISQTALDKASSLVPPELSSTVFFKSGDFFNLKDDERFDLIYDYTFFVAIPPTLRPAWGEQMRSLIKPGGYLITLIWPIDPYTETGPPYYVRPEHYIEPLGDGWEKVVDREPDCSSENHVGKERLVVWKRLQV
ncbi:hypothetical protein VNI00_012678 [Paramarasmius palmivorus]|uniref:S-adenosyl-L-methionine-dependent methyltransferase n=1 Tax=Paramarasmius palmivorus TaxID=297713 RepID=A0AAW0C2Y2_9AGAR